MPRRLAALATLSLGALLGCASPSSSQDSLPERYLGQWYYMGSSGGIDGGGMRDEPTGYIVIHPDNTVDHHAEDGTLTASTSFELGRGSTIFSTEEQWILNPSSAVPEVIVVSEDGRAMFLSENVYDGYQRGYARAR